MTDIRDEIAALPKMPADELVRRVIEVQRKRAVDMPTEKDAIDALMCAWLRLKEMGWSEQIYCPKDGSWFDAIEAGSTGIHLCQYTGEWPTGSWWIADENDLYPSRPILWRPIAKVKP